MKIAPRISRVFRCASQRSIHAKMARTNRMLKAAKAASPSVVHKSNSGCAAAIPTQTPQQHSPPRIVDTSASPNTR